MKTTYLNLYFGINSKTAADLMFETSNLLHESQPERLYVLFSSWGGAPDSAVVLHNFFRSLPIPIVMHASGAVLSAAISVFLAADVRYANPQCKFLIHRTKSTNKESRNSVEITEQVRHTESDDRISLDLIGSRTGLPKQRLRRIYFKGHYFESPDAKSLGFVTDIRQARFEDCPGIVTLRLIDKEG